MLIVRHRGRIEAESDMQRVVIGFSLLLAAGFAQAQAPASCASLPTRALPVQPTMLAPLAPELTAPTHQLGSPSGVLAQAFDEALSVDQVLLRMRIESCQAIARATMPATPGMPSSTDPAAYKPKTQFDNTPWRFDMSQNGKRMTADEFSAWMKARGVRVARGAAPAAVPVAPAMPSDPLTAPAPAVPGDPLTAPAPASSAPLIPPVTPPEPPKPPSGKN
jgi:hypothetical protein